MIALLIGVLAAHRLTRLVTTDTFPPILALRERLLARWPSEDTRFTSEWVNSDGTESLGGVPVIYSRDGEWIPERGHWLGDLITCPWCAGFWISVLVALALWTSAAVVLEPLPWVLLPFAFSSVVGWLSARD